MIVKEGEVLLRSFFLAFKLWQEKGGDGRMERARRRGSEEVSDREEEERRAMDKDRRRNVTRNMREKTIEGKM